MPYLLFANAALPTLGFIWPFSLVLFLPIVAVEVLYARKKMGLTHGQAWWMIGLANLISTAVGLPIAIAATYGQIAVQYYVLGAKPLSWEVWKSNGHAEFAGMYGTFPLWEMVMGVVIVTMVCFLASWWVESVCVRLFRRRTRRGGDNPSEEKAQISRAMRNANLWSYALVLVAFAAMMVHVWNTPNPDFQKMLMDLQSSQSH